MRIFFSTFTKFLVRINILSLAAVKNLFERKKNRLNVNSTEAKQEGKEGRMHVKPN